MFELEKIAAKNGIEIVLKNAENQLIYSSNKDFLSNIELQNNEFNSFVYFIISKNEVREVKDIKTSIRYLSLNKPLDNGYELSLRLAISPVEESVRISNTFLSIIGTIIIIISGIIILLVSRRFMEPIKELEVIAKKNG